MTDIDGRASGTPPSVQTFLPFPDFAASAAALDRQRLGKQRAEHYRPLFGDVPVDLPYVWPASDRARRVPLDAGMEFSEGG